MTLRGSAFLALWNDFDPARDGEYNLWHTFEHVPERVGIEGFISGRRYVARERTEKRYFTLYELDGLAALDGPGYKDVVDRPTEWSAAMRPSFRNFLRSPCETIVTTGLGTGGALATFRFGAAAAPAASAASASLQPFLETAGITAVHLGRVAAAAGFPVKNAVSPGSAVSAAPLVLLVEGLGRGELAAAAPSIAAALGAKLGADQPLEWEGYELAFVIGRSDLKSPTTARQPPRSDLRERIEQVAVPPVGAKHR
jgi:hypothetical protein